jgi:Spy/CpxP family protein refolding chaperone
MRFAAGIVLAFVCVPALAQHQHAPAQPYGGLQQREIKALGNQQIDDLRAGRGMGLALAAELNGYPGPMHVLELADRLDLAPQQRDRIQEFFVSMKAEAMAAGERLIEDEAALDRAFAGGTIDERQLRALTERIGQSQAALRAVHLKYHLTTADLLSDDQKSRYGALRGYR